MSDFNHTTQIRNPYGNSSSRSSSSTAPRPSISPSTTETMLRNLVRSTTDGAMTMTDIPSLSSIQSVKDQLCLRRDIRWSLDLAQGLGELVLNYMRLYMSGSSSNTDTSAEAVGVAMLGLLATAIEDWEDNVLYAVLIQDGKKNINRVKNDNPGSCKHLLDILTQLSVLSSMDSDNNNNDGDNGPCSNLSQNAIICLATAWRCLDRLEQFTTLNGNNGGYGRENSGVPWWITDECPIMNRLAVLSLQSLCQTFCSDPQDEFNVRRQQLSIPDTEHRKMSALTIVAIILRYELVDLSSSSMSNVITTTSGGCVLPETKLSELISKLIKCIQILNHSVLPPSSSEYTLPIAMLSMSVLSLLQGSLASSENNSLFHGLNQTIQSTGLVENLVQFTFLSVFAGDDGSSSMQAPRWIASSSKRFKKGYLQSFGLQLFSYWSYCDNVAWKVVIANLEPKLRYIIDPFWSNLLLRIDHRQPSMDSNMEAQLPGIFWLYLYNRGHARLRLSLVLEKSLEPGGTSSFTAQNGDADNVICRNRGSEKILHCLFGILRLSSNVSYSTRLTSSRLLRLLLADRRIISSNDELSRSIWTAVNQSVVELYLETVLEHTSTDDANQPLLLTLVDTMETLLEDGECCTNFIDKLGGANNIETLIHISKPSDIRYDFNLGTEEADTDTETPPLHNLSRMDEASICIEHEEMKDPRGLDHSVRLSVMTVLARMAYHSSIAAPDESTGLLISRISTAVNDSLVEYHTLVEGDNDDINGNNCSSITPSMDQKKRFFRLQHVIANPENEEFLFSMMLTGGSLRKKKILRLVDTQKETEYKLQMTLQREKKAQEEKMRLLQQLRTQSIMFRREMSRTKLNMTQDTRQLVAMHASERCNAEERSRNLMQHTEQAKLELERAKMDMQTAQDELHMATTKVLELNGNIETIKQEVQDERAKADEILNEIEANREEKRSFEEKCREMQRGIDERENVISQADDTNHKLQDNLEDLFADMVSLTQIFKHNEDQEESNKQKNNDAIESANQKLVLESQRNKDLKEENEKLYRKLAKYKERLEQERKGRQEEHKQRKEEDNRKKRSGPVSYLNSLHTSTTSEVSSRNKSSRSSRDISASQRPPSSRPRESQRQSQRPSNTQRQSRDKENSSSSNQHSTCTTSQRRKEN